METRFRDLLTEAAQLAQEYHHDFGAALKPPPAITAFRFKSAGVKAKQPLPPKVAAAKAVNPAIAPLEKRLLQTRRKLDAAKAGGKATQSLEDKIYEIEDAIRLATWPA